MLIYSENKDVGLAIDASNMAAGAIIFGNWTDNVHWVRNVVVLAQSDQQYDVGVGRRDFSGATDIGSTVASTQNAVLSPNWRSHPLTGSSGVLGYSVRFFIKNSAAVPNTYGRLRAQLLGL
ncbi:hypothetical protein SD71_10765 [Cohnella kolymensis]|uniref:Uncharacterized protein n=1 Tax=Cohnella kolymensis TaxID=1590652 RepID=A0ABR5A494_9BACL|nr:hypothetical protein [Cohnella kolymensis]KIL35864.1 hypothetical protein SD71_10765 [Cohnella kolymensis]